ncbi:3-hydroxyacyl-CoA dehydrogenase family protein [Sulfoacidibacillus thermotolerans]|uniref:3-hydroxybutyryl-CoA dehydrogenase n=1 Tax=Sulfoacidibacillus thermotolerans TaxID=1765684 RepID=A0A2U3D760_SULT2|nr:3-hydroxyacyl-CoA dehydrogenase family protein [Sulfoacidibacillus thermotolerans]PWI57116.1 hypothetical protein BM613_10185 [Sulfoacidibacillus thermotolerans]
MTASRVLLLGDRPVCEEIIHWLSAKGDDVMRFTDALEDYSTVSVVIECIADAALRKSSLERVEAVIPEHALVYVSGLNAYVTEVASWFKHPQRVCGFQPWLIASMDVLELVRPLQMEQDELWKRAQSFWQERGKQIESIADYPGMVFPRILAMIVNEAAFALGEAVASASDIDIAMKFGTNYPLGPFEWADQIGLDEILSVLQGMHRYLGEDIYRPAPLLQKLVYAKWLGESSGRGFYSYLEGSKQDIGGGQQ